MESLGGGIKGAAGREEVLHREMRARGAREKEEDAIADADLATGTTRTGFSSRTEVAGRFLSLFYAGRTAHGDK